MSLQRKLFRIEAGVVGVSAASREPADARGFDGRAAVADTAQERAAHAAAGQLATDLRAMAEAISATKREVADLQRPPAGSGSIQRATCELDAVSAATARATTTILSAVEEIELSANLLRASGGAAERNEPADAILDRVLVLYEACNFQDITGQRIRKVVTTLKFVEERLDRMMAVWGGTVPMLLPGDSPAGAEGLLGGPSLPGEDGHVSQSDVDAYFS